MMSHSSSKGSYASFHQIQLEKAGLSQEEVGQIDCWYVAYLTSNYMVFLSHLRPVAGVPDTPNPGEFTHLLSVNPVSAKFPVNPSS